MGTYSTFKIPIITGINDQPKAPNYEGNGRGPSGSYFTQQFNDLLDTLNEDVPEPNSPANEEDLTTNKTLTDADYGWQVLKPTGAHRTVNITATAPNTEFLVINDSDTYNLLIKENGTLTATLLPGEALMLKRTATKWVGLKFNNYGVL